MWENHPMWSTVDDALKPFRVAARGSRMKDRSRANGLIFDATQDLTGVRGDGPATHLSS